MAYREMYYFFMKVIVDGQGHKDTFVERVNLGTSARTRNLQSEYKVALGQPLKIYFKFTRLTDCNDF